jgi:type III restriction enzyme
MKKNIKFEELKIIDVNSELIKYRIPYEKLNIPTYISENLKYNFFEWQKDAIEKFLGFESVKEIKNPNTPTHLMFNMATGTGKTLVMASMILYYYKKGYRHFLFFVNQNNIVDKTENNFIDSTHTKYLFKDKIVIDDETVQIKKVENFSDNPQGIEIKFTSIQKLYNDIHLQKENKTTLEDLHKLNIIMLADEAHHLNANTKKRVQQTFEIKNNASKDIIEKLGWEHTIIELILNKNGKKENNRNVLLEFTATIPSTEEVAKKYEDKIIYKFGLKEFLQAGYTKEINLISSTLNKKERVLQALIFQWYRHKIALKHNISNFKPVILFRSKTIEESKNDYEEFSKWINDISNSDFKFLKTIENRIYQSKKQQLFEMGKSRTEQVLNFIKNENITFSEISKWIKDNYQERNTIITNSKTNKTKKEKTDEETEKLLNSLEDKNNHIRAIFTVDRLTEGWDVLNLFDIVRLYQGQNAGGSTKTTPEATIKEKQLIGRGVRYYPFTYKDKIKNKRKFDDDLNNELRILEELFYYTYDEDSRYISHLKNELRKDGYIKDDKIVKEFDLKKEFKESDFYKTTKIWYNKTKNNPNRQKRSLTDIKSDLSFSYKVKSLKFKEEEVEFENKDNEKINLKEKETHTIKRKFKDIEKHIFYKAINIKAKQENSLFRFENLQKELNIKTIEDLRKDKFLGDFEIKIVLNKNKNYDDIENSEKLEITIKFLDKFSNEFKKEIVTKIGTEFMVGEFKKFFSQPKYKTIDEDKLDENIPKEKWYILNLFAGTSEEKALINFIKESFGNLEEKYNEIYLLRNEEVYKIYDFKEGRGFQPDFLLFLKSKKDNKNNEISYQIFIEPKGDQFIDIDGTFKNGKEGWKEEFLEEISKKYGMKQILKNESKSYRLIGLPFFNEKHNSDFEEEFNSLYEKRI